MRRKKKPVTGQAKIDYTLRRSKRLKHEVGGTIREAMSGIYHVLFDIGDTTYSAYCFVDSGQWRLFWPYANGHQNKKTFQSQNSLIRHIRALRQEAKEEAGCR